MLLACLWGSPRWTFAAEANPDVDSRAETTSSDLPKEKAEPKPHPPAPPSSYDIVVVEKRPPAPGTISEIDATDISLRGARNLPEAIAFEPSVEIQHSPKAGATIQIRGFDERTVLLTIEGIPIREVYDGHFDIASLPAFALGHITLERGVTSVLHGPNSAGGVLSLEAPTRCDAHLDASTLASSPHDQRLLLYSGRAKGCARMSDLTLHASAGYDHSSGYVLSDNFQQTRKNAQFHEDGGIRDGSDYERASAALLAKFTPRRGSSLSLFLDAIHAPRGIPPFESAGYLRFWRFTAYDTLLAGISGVYGPAPSARSVTWGLRELRAQIYAHVHRDEIRDYEDTTYAHLTTNPLAWFLASAYANETYGTALESSWSLARGNELDTSLRYNLDVHRQRERPVPQGGAETDWTPWERYASHTLAAAVEDTQVAGPWRINAGLGMSGMSLLAEEIRNTTYPVDRRLIPALEARLVTERTLADGFEIMASAGRKVRYPTLKELFSNSVGGNPNLQTERAWMVETGFDSKGLLIPHLDVTARLFWSSIEDLIELYRNVYANIGHAMTTGAEIEARYRPIRHLQIFAGYRYLYARDVEHDRPLDYRTPHRILVGARLVTDSGLSCAVEATHSSGQEAYYVDSVTAHWIADNLPPYGLLAAHLRYEHALGQAMTAYLFADGFNLLGTNYYVGSFEPRPGRALVFGLGVRI